MTEITWKTVRIACVLHRVDRNSDRITHGVGAETEFSTMSMHGFDVYKKKDYGSY